MNLWNIFSIYTYNNFSILNWTIPILKWTIPILNWTTPILNWKRYSYCIWLLILQLASEVKSYYKAIPISYFCVNSSESLLRQFCDRKILIQKRSMPHRSKHFLSTFCSLHGFTKKLRQAQKYPFLPNLRVLNSNLKSVFTHHL